jgi:hypothetical protein
VTQQASWKKKIANDKAAKRRIATRHTKMLKKSKELIAKVTNEATRSIEKIMDFMLAEQRRRFESTDALLMIVQKVREQQISAFEVDKKLGLLHNHIEAVEQKAEILASLCVDLNDRVQDIEEDLDLGTEESEDSTMNTTSTEEGWKYRDTESTESTERKIKKLERVEKHRRYGKEKYKHKYITESESETESESREEFWPREKQKVTNRKPTYDGTKGWNNRTNVSRPEHQQSYKSGYAWKKREQIGKESSSSGESF